MARKIQVVLEDDLSGGTADETVVFGLDGVSYEIDLSTRNADKLRAVLEPYVKVARKAAGAKTRRRSSSAATSNAGEVRAWAQSQGIKVSERGRVSADVIAQFEAAKR